MRQWLNSKAGVNAWWAAQHKGDVKPAELATKAGFLTGFDDDFLSCLTPIKIVTIPNTISEPDKNTPTEVTYDKIFCQVWSKCTARHRQAGRATTGSTGREPAGVQHLVNNGKYTQKWLHTP